MHINAKKILTTTAVLAALASGPALYAYAEDSSSPSATGAAQDDHGGMTSPNTMGDMAGMSKMMGQMSEMMDTCNNMMKTAASKGSGETSSDGGRQ
ncbi:MAG TPA: hypothetical protein VE914_18645 [Candidatus Angelobacter sp.]|nr:hypothetical protein [Candidatus Angelobacter sp.]